MKGRAVVHSSDRMNWGTPRDFYAWADAAFGFTIDACAEKWNAKHRRFWSKEQNALAQDWSTEIAWNNPEYGDAVGDFLEAAKEGARNGGTSVNLVPSRVDTAWFRRATEQGMGRLRRSGYHPFSRVLWLCWRDVTVGVYHHNERLVFELPEAERQARIKAGKNPNEPAPFPSTLIIYDPPLWRARLGGKRLPTATENNAAIAKWGRPLLTSARPR